MSTESEALRKIVKENLRRFTFSGGSTNLNIRIPKYDLYPRDYLEYAKSDITDSNAKKLLDCVGNLKRAVDCQIGIFLNVFGLERYFKKRKLGIDKKLELLRAVGIFDSRTLSRLNTIRNRMEHRYEIPKIKDVEIYFDLVLAFVSVLESSIVLLSWTEMDFTNEKDARGRSVESSKGDESIYLNYDFEEPIISITYEYIPDRWKKIEARNKNEMASDLGKDPAAIYYGGGATPTDNYDDFVFYFRVYYLLALRGAFVNDKYILARL
jgi:hypothetical protein